MPIVYGLERKGCRRRQISTLWKIKGSRATARRIPKRGPARELGLREVKIRGGGNKKGMPNCSARHRDFIAVRCVESEGAKNIDQAPSPGGFKGKNSGSARSFPTNRQAMRRARQPKKEQAGLSNSHVGRSQEIVRARPAR